MSELNAVQYGLIALIFVWSGFVRSGLGFGGAALSLPFLLLVHDQPVVFLPIIAIHLLVFSSITVGQSHLAHRRRADPDQESSVDWPYLRRVMLILIIPKLAGVFGLLTLPGTVMSAIIFCIVGLYSITYIFKIPFRSKSKTLDVIFLAIGGYVSGTSLVGAPLIIAVMAQHVGRHQLRDTLFVLWFILVCIKLSAFIWVGVDLQLMHQLWLLPAAAVGHVIGLRFHARLLKTESTRFYQGLGVVLLVTSSLGIVRVFL